MRDDLEANEIVRAQDGRSLTAGPFGHCRDGVGGSIGFIIAFRGSAIGPSGSRAQA
jgi:hypothetical protein